MVNYQLLIVRIYSMERRIVRLIRVNRILILWAHISLWIVPNFLLPFAPIIDTIYKVSLYSIIFVIAHHQVFFPLDKLPPTSCIYPIEIGFALIDKHSLYYTRIDPNISCNSRKSIILECFIRYFIVFSEIDQPLHSL